MNILITGANGFIGSTLAKDLLVKGHNIYGIVTNTKAFENITSKNLKLFEIYFDNYDKISALIKDNIDIVFHCAWAGLNGPSAKDVNLQVSNIVATAKLVEEVAKLNAKKLVFVSTMNTLEIRDALTNPENHKLRPVSIHVSSKINAEIVARTFCEMNSIDINVALLAMVYGENNYSTMITNVVIDTLLKGNSPKLISGNNIYDLIYVNDVVSGLEAIAFKGKSKKTYYVGHNENKTFKELFLRVGELINPEISLRFGEYPDDNYINFSLIDRALLTKDTGWKPSASFDESIIKTAKWIEKYYGKQ